MDGAAGFVEGADRLRHWPGACFTQIAWTTNDIDRALPLLQNWLGARDFVRVGDRLLTVMTPDGERVLRQNLAFGRAGAVSIELIEPIGDDGGFWSDGFGETGFAMRQHHLSIAIDGDRSAWQAFRDQAAAIAPVPVQGRYERSHFLFVDLRPALGCYLEATWRDPDSREGRQAPPTSTSTMPSTTRDA
ncbi:VOC family protein [Rhizorhabdus dicambivorans]|uniref:VOC domain-containing protein n=1 Tax=Rhizorhabdus dicambivorans TaxID=1850238 RepID=A0A2A4FT30_9SPHN|nr:VOC family protein [Rhizorhabdus dicambivorans]ATE64268.1 hypothetical protein CMV14_07560 [Rhizorhabdus dicambivorans]PCE40561.1 hypothetical protein COO09_19750 [Rhizorhabdus dicambivorans]